MNKLIYYINIKMDKNEKSNNFLKCRFTKWNKTDDHIEYIIKIISTKDDNINVDFSSRYSILRDLHDILRKEANTSKYPKFPPKKYFGNTDEKFLNQRMAALDHYFNQVFEEFSNLKELKKWIEDKFTKFAKKQVKEVPKEDKSIQKTKQDDNKNQKKINEDKIASVEKSTRVNGNKFQLKY